MDGRPLERTPNLSRIAIHLQKSASICAGFVLFCGITFVYAGATAALSHCNLADRDQVSHYHWDCNKYYTADFLFVSVETVLTSIVGGVLLLGQKKILRLPLLFFLVVITIFTILGATKYIQEDAGVGYFLNPTDKDTDDRIKTGERYWIDITRHNDPHDHQASSFKYIELNRVETIWTTKKVIAVGYSLISIGNGILILLIGTKKMPSVILPDMGKYKKTMDRFRSRLAGVIAPRTRPVTSEEEEERMPLTESEMTKV